MDDNCNQCRMRAESVFTDKRLSDIRIFIDGKTRHMWGRNGILREEQLARSIPESSLVILFGAGLGVCLKELLEKGHQMVVVDREQTLSDASGTGKLAAHDNVHWIEADSPTQAAKQIQALCQKTGLSAHILKIPFYIRLDRDYYEAIESSLASPQNENAFWNKCRYPKFNSAKPKILFFKTQYFLINEIESAFEQLGLTWRGITVPDTETADQSYVEDLIKAVLEFKPDFALTVNHFGMDRDGKLTNLLERMGLPLASWFVDNPHLILYRYQGLDANNIVLFTYDSANIENMAEHGFKHIHYLPLATDPGKFHPNAGPAAPSWKSDVSFVGNGMVSSVQRYLEKARPPEKLQNNLHDIAAEFGDSHHVSVSKFLHDRHPEYAMEILSASLERSLALESLITWEATRIYRTSCVEKLLEFSPLIVGSGWEYLQSISENVRLLPSVHYYKEAPRFYPASKISFNCTSVQMKGAVNQRVFDVPASGGFLLTDYRKQMEDLFDLDLEAAVYHSPEEIPDMITSLLSDEKKRKRISSAARARILNEHTYIHRLKKLCSIMHETFA